jgi:HAMP domain-containing protein
MFARLSLRGKFNALFVLVLFIGLVLGGALGWIISQNIAESEFTARGLILIQVMKSVRSYTSSDIQPLIADKVSSSPTFISESVPAFSARTVFDSFHNDGLHKAFSYKEASPNPTNPADRADAFETAIVDQMQRTPALSQLSGYRQMNGQQFFYIAMPLTVSQQSCLTCHGDPANAPKNLLATYGSANGFGWRLNQTIAAQMVYVPAGDVANEALQRFLILAGALLILFVVSVLLIDYTLRRYVLQPVNLLDGLASKVSEDAITPEVLDAVALNIPSSSDELGKLARVFRNMARQVYHRAQELKQQVEQLHIEIDEIKRKKQVAEVVESTGFIDIATRARDMRKQREANEGQSNDEPTAK